jgi:hypothetical protein
MQLQVDINPWHDVSIDLAFNGTLPIVNLEIPKGAVPLPESNISLTLDASSKLRINPVLT